MKAGKECRRETARRIQHATHVEHEARADIGKASGGQGGHGGDKRQQLHPLSRGHLADDGPEALNDLGVLQHRVRQLRVLAPVRQADVGRAAEGELV